MTAIKNMTLEELCAESRRIDLEIDELDTQLDACRERWDRKTVLLDGWRKRMSAIPTRLLEINRGAAPAPGEVDALFARQDKLYERYEMRARERWAMTREMQDIDKPMNTLYRRASNVQTRINRLRWEAQQAA